MKWTIETVESRDESGKVLSCQNGQGPASVTREKAGGGTGEAANDEFPLPTHGLLCPESSARELFDLVLGFHSDKRFVAPRRPRI